MSCHVIFHYHVIFPPGSYFPPLAVRIKIINIFLFFPGYYCDLRLSNVSSPRPCPEGHYCPAGTARPNPCPAGSFNSRQRLGGVSGCTPCAAGRYCPSAGLSEPAGGLEVLLSLFFLHLKHLEEVYRCLSDYGKHFF